MDPRSAFSVCRNAVVTTLLLLAFSSPSFVHANDMFYEGLPESTSPGGRCMDGTMAGYHIRNGTDDSLFVIYLKGGGGCSTEDDCTARNGTTLGSSRNWPASMQGAKLLDGDCTLNPFCNATAVHVGYCTSDAHLGNNTETSDDTWGFYFDGHANFAAIVEQLIADRGLGDAEHVLLTGGSAGSIGAIFNLDWLADRLGPEVNVKGVPNAGWYNPGALPGDLPPLFRPSDYDHFAAGENGNDFYDAFVESGGAVLPDRFMVKGLLSDDCLADYEENEWWTCGSAHQAYRYIKAPFFNVHSQYDSNQIFSSQGFAPTDPEESEVETVKRYIEMWGNATRYSFQPILDNDTIVPKDYPDGVFSTSCLSHGTGNREIDGLTWLPIVYDWFYELGEMTEYYRLIETCDVEEGGIEMPCNPAKNCGYDPNPKPKPPPKVTKCLRAMDYFGCIESFGNKNRCMKCARRNKKKLRKGGSCSKKIVKRLCTFAKKNDIDKYL